jgi:hypothetical protein
MGAQALIVGIGRPHADGWDAPALRGVELDCQRVESLLRDRSFSEVVVLQERDATHDIVLRNIKSAARAMAAGDLFVFYYSGHGAQDRRQHGGEEQYDEVLLTNERVIVDDELGEIWPTFLKGVRILMVSDCCSSGTIFRSARPTTRRARSTHFHFGFSQGTRDARPVEEYNIDASLIAIGACADDERAKENQGGGVFTSAMMACLPNATNYNDLHDQIRIQLQPRQDSQMHVCGPKQPREAFVKQRPFDRNPPGLTEAEENRLEELANEADDVWGLREWGSKK